MGHYIKKFIKGRVNGMIATMILRDVLQAHGIQTVGEFARRGHLTIQQAWNLWHGYSQVGLHVAKRIAQDLEIPLEELVTLEPTPKTPARWPRTKPPKEDKESHMGRSRRPRKKPRRQAPADE